MGDGLYLSIRSRQALVKSVGESWRLRISSAAFWMVRLAGSWMDPTASPDADRVRFRVVTVAAAVIRKDRRLTVYFLRCLSLPVLAWLKSLRW